MKTLTALNSSLGAIAMVLAAGNAALAAPVFQPIAISPTNFNADAIVEKTASALWRNVNANVDGGTNSSGDTWFEIGYDQNLVSIDNNYTNATFLPGVPHPGTVFVGLQTNYNVLGGGSGPSGTVAPPGTYQYLMAPSYTNFADCTLIDTTVTTNYITITSPKAFGALSFLDSSGNGGNEVAVTIYHADGKTDYGIIAAGDWFGGANPAYIAYGRVNVQTGAFDTQASITSPGNPNWYGRDLQLTDTTSPVTGIGFGYVGGAANVHNQVFAVSGASTPTGPFLPVAYTGYNYGMVVPASGTNAGPAICTVGPNAGSIATTVAMNQDTSDTGNTWFEQGYCNIMQPQAGIPVQGSTWTNGLGDHSYTMAPDYTTNDVIYVAPGSNNVALTFATPKAYNGLSLLTGTSYGPQDVAVQVNFTDGTSETHVLTLQDWFNGSSAVWFSSGGVSVDTMTLNNIQIPPTGVPNNDANPPPSINPVPYLHNSDFLLVNNTKLVTGLLFSDQGINFTNDAGATAVFAVSGATGPVPPAITGLPNEIMPNIGQTNAYPGDTVNFNVDASSIVGTPPYTLQWQTDGGTVPPAFTNFVDNGTTIVGSQTTNLTLSNVQPISTEQVRLLAYNGGGTNVTPAILYTVTVPLTGSISNISTPSDPISTLNPPYAGFQNTPNEGVTHAIDGLVGADPGKYLNFSLNDNNTPFLGPIGFITTPSIGPTIVTGMQQYTANDTPGEPGGMANLQAQTQPSRDPMDVGLYGSNDGGNTWHFIYGNPALEPPQGRNSAPSAPYNVTNDYMQQMLFNNTNTYYTYSWWVTNVFSDATESIMQIGEVVLLGTANPAFAAEFPTIQVTNNARAYVTNTQGLPASVTINAALGGAPSTIQWSKEVNGVYVPLTNAGNISGANTTNLTINPTTFADATNYEATASNSFGVVSAVVQVQVFSTLPIATSQYDTIVDFGDKGLGSPNAADGGVDESANLLQPEIDNYINDGSGPNAGAGFVPFAGPAGVIVTLQDPNTGNTAPYVIQGIRLYADTEAYGDTANDPADVELYGSNNGGTNFTLIYANSSPAVYLPLARNTAGAAFDPVSANPPSSLVELLFTNSLAFSTYKIQFTNDRDDANTTSVQLGHLDLLGYESTVQSPTVSFTYSAGQLTLTSDTAGEVYSTSALNPPNTTWTAVGPITAGGNVVIPVTTTNKAEFYQVVADPQGTIH